MNKIYVFIKQNLSVCLLLCTVTLLALIAFFFNQHKYSYRDIRRDISSAIPAVNPGDVSEIRVASALFSGRNKATIRFDGEKWRVAERNNAQADTTFIVNFLDQISKFRVLREITNDENNETLRSLNLQETISQDSSGKENIPGIKVELADKNGSILLSMVLGRGHLRPQENSQAVSQLDGRYAAIKDETGKPKIYLISKTFQECVPLPSVWVEKISISNIRQVSQMRYAKLEKKPRVIWWIRLNQETGDFSFHFPADEKIQQSELMKKFQLLGSPLSLDLDITKSADKMQFTDEVQLVLKNGFSYTLRMLKQPDLKMFASLSVHFYPEHVTRIYGETDEQYSLRKNQLTERYKFEQESFNDKVFLVRNDLIDVLQPVPK